VAEELEENDDVFVAKVVLSENPSLVVSLFIPFCASFSFFHVDVMCRSDTLSPQKVVKCGFFMATATPLCIISLSPLIVFF
jgi:hypothetical protein